MDPVLAKVWDLGVESLLEQWPVVSESGNGGTGSTTPEDQISGVGLSSSEVEARLGDFVGWAFNVLLRLVKVVEELRNVRESQGFIKHDHREHSKCRTWHIQKPWRS